MLQSDLLKLPPLWDGHWSKATNAKSAQASSHAVVTIWDDHMSNVTSGHFFVSQKKKHPLKQH